MFPLQIFPIQLFPSGLFDRPIRSASISQNLNFTQNYQSSDRVTINQFLTFSDFIIVHYSINERINQTLSFTQTVTITGYEKHLSDTLFFTQSIVVVGPGP